MVFAGAKAAVRMYVSRWLLILNLLLGNEGTRDSEPLTS
jgi:hypothetical protein